MRKYAFTLIAIIMAFIIVTPVHAYDNNNDATGHSNMDQIWQIVSAARGSGQFSYEFELAPSAAQV